jgi:tRNA A-37 threonylcarbamoyl transferase component Bud32
MVPGFAGERELGQGASGRVVAAVSVVTGQPVAIKYLTSRLFRDDRFLARFRAEAELLRSVDVPQIVRFFDYAEAPGQGAAIIMELVSGVSLHEIIERNGATSPEAALVVLKGSLLGLAAAHAIGIVHRDYKPENVLVDAQGNSKLTDFGVAVRAGDDAPAAGTPLYMAPEQWAGAPATPATDIYAASAVFFECLTGKTPFTGRPGQLYQQHAATAVPVDQLDEPLRSLVARGMAKDPAHRPASATDLVTQLEATATEAYGGDWESRGAGKLAEYAAALLLLLAKTALGSAATTTSTSTSTSWTSTTVTAPKAAAVAAKGGALSGMHMAIAGALAVAVAASVTGGLIAAKYHNAAIAKAAAPPSALPPIAYATTTALYARSGTVAPGVLASLPPGAQASEFTWSSDGRWLGWFSGPASKATDQVHITDTTARETHSWPCASCSVGAFQDGHLLVSGNVQGTLTAFPEDGGPPATISLSGPAMSGTPQILTSTPHDASVLFFAGDDVSGALYETALSGEVRLVSRLPFPAGPGGDRVLGGAGLIATSPDGTILAYGGNYLGGDIGQGSDCVTIVNLVTGVASITRLPADPVQPLRISAVWVDGTGTAYATAWHQPGIATGVLQAAVIPHQYRLDNGHWVDTGPRNDASAVGRSGWLAILEEPPTIISYRPQGPGHLVATLGVRQIDIASNVTAFAWDTPRS